MSAKRCPLFSAAWNVQCEKREGHKGRCVSGGDVFYGSPPATLNAPQPPPTSDDAGPEVWPSLLAEVALSPELRALCEERDALGRAKYGTPLRAHNGRDALKDALQEALDLAAYLQQAAMEVEDAGRCFRGARFRDWRDVALDIARDLLGEVTP